MDDPEDLTKNSSKRKLSNDNIDEKESNCQFFLQRKRRKCKALKKIGPYCTEHSYLLSDDNGGRKRIPCPLDPNHTVFEDSLQKHLKKCNKRPELRPVCFKENINAGDADGENPSSYKVTLRTVEESEILEMIPKCKQLYKDHIGSIRTDVRFHEVMREEFEKPDNGKTAHKHILQQASLIGHMDRLGLLDNHHCFMEFGSGKGGLSHWVQKSVAHHEDSQFVLVDKSSVRYKMDNFHKRVDQGPSFERIKLDIKDLDIQMAPNLENDRKIIAVGKHLCGAATDLMLRCLSRLEPHSAHARDIQGVVLALCCHHRCDWAAYTGKAFMRKCGITARQFSIMCGMTSWATCATRHVDPDDASKEVAATYQHSKSGNMLPQEREELGNQCKQLIDHGRAEFLRELGFESELVAFIDKKQTLENVCLLAHKPVSDEKQAEPVIDNCEVADGKQVELAEHARDIVADGSDELNNSKS